MAEARATAAGAKLRRAFITSEGVDLRLQLGSAGDRALAFTIDLIFMIIGLVVLSIVAIMLFGAGDAVAQQTIAIIWLLGAFAVRNGYFIAFELGMRAATPGKRMVKLRVVARDGGRLTGEAVIARNLMRELEFFLPLSFVFTTGVGGWVDFASWLAGLAVVAVFLLFPLFNRDRLRVGDLVAGTWVVKVPRHELGRSVGEHAPEPHFVFTDAQLGAYGEFELQKLEEVLRRADELSLIVVARTIRGRIGWTGHDGDDHTFLQAYYTALCQRLERGMLFGKRRADKYQKG